MPAEQQSSDPEHSGAVCARVQAFAPQLVEGRDGSDGLVGDLAGPVAETLRVHAATCVPCAAVLARQVRLCALLRALPPAPEVELVAPRLPRARGLRLAASAAAVAAALVISLTLLISTRDEGAEAAYVPVRVLQVHDMDERAPLPDDDLLALTSGLEAVALRRPVGFPSEGR